jgi:UDP-N-acetylglucosamine acyltransferase
VAIHPTAIIDPAAELDPAVEVGAYAVIDGPVKVAADTRIYPQAYLTGWTEIGARCEIHPFAVVGHLPQDFHFSGSRTYCRIGAGTIVREHVSIHRGTQPESVTEIGRDCFILAGAHVGHNCVLGDRVTIVGGTCVGGHTEIGEGAMVSASALFHQFVRVGEYAMISGGARVTMDALPFMITQERNVCGGVNVVGMQRAEFSAAEIAEMRAAYKVLYRSGLPVGKAIDKLEAEIETEAGRRLLAFLKGPSRRGLGVGPRHACRHSPDTRSE